MKTMLKTLAVLALAGAFMPAMASAAPVPYKQAVVTYDAGNPTSFACSGYQRLWWNTVTNVLWFCENGTWVSTLAAVGVSFPLAANTGCVTTPYGFTADATAGLCLVAENHPQLQTGTAPAAGTTSYFALPGANENFQTFLSFVNVDTPTFTAKMHVTSSTPSLLIRAENGVDSTYDYASLNIEGDSTPSVDLSVGRNANENNSGLTLGHFTATLASDRADSNARISLSTTAATLTGPFDAASLTLGYSGQGTAAFDTNGYVKTVPPTGAGNFVIAEAYIFQIPDNGNGGTPASYAFEPQSMTAAVFDCADPQGCEVTIGEANVVAGQHLVVIEDAATSGNITLINGGGFTRLDAGANVVFTGVGDAVTLVYTGTLWTQVTPLYDAS